MIAAARNFNCTMYNGTGRIDRRVNHGVRRDLVLMDGLGFFEIRRVVVRWMSSFVRSFVGGDGRKSRLGLGIKIVSIQDGVLLRAVEFRAHVDLPRPYLDPHISKSPSHFVEEKRRVINETRWIKCPI